MPTMARTTIISIRVKPAVAVGLLVAEASDREIIEAKHRDQQRPHDGGDDDAHEYGDRRNQQGDKPLDRLMDLFVVDIGGAQRHLAKLPGFLAELQQVDRLEREKTTGAERDGEMGAGLDLN